MSKVEENLSARLEFLSILVFGSTRQMLLESLEVAIAQAWQRYLDCDSNDPDVESELRQRLASRFRPY